MTKKILSVIASTAILATGAAAFDIFDDVNQNVGGIPYGYENPIANNNVKGNAPSYTAATNFTIAGQKQFGDALIFPAFFVGNGWETTLRVINTSSTNAVVAKVVLYAGDDSRELRDFNIYLSAGDVWKGTIKIDTDGQARLISTDDSSPLPGGGMADADNPMKSEPIATPAGYIAVIGCASTISANGAHGAHGTLRTEYNQLVSDARINNTPVVFNNGIITSGANVPNVNLNNGGNGVTTTTTTNPYTFIGVPNVLAGDVRITDTVKGKDMVMPAIRLQNVTEDGNGVQQALLFAEGEAANIADRSLTGGNGAQGSTNNNNNPTTSEYDYAVLKNDIAQFNTSNIWMTYGDTDSLANNQLILTSPFKRIAVFADVNPVTATTPTPVGSNGNLNVVGSTYTGVTSANSTIANFGSFQALALVYDESENQAQASQFSPANTPTLNFQYEVSATENNPNDTDNLSFYLNQAENFKQGYTILNFRANGQPAAIPVIATQMMATEAAGKVITNWIVPAQK
jgi:hypothetical protein